MNRKDCPKCPRCKSNANAVKLLVGFRCCFCGIKFYDNEEGVQQRLNL